MWFVQHDEENAGDGFSALKGNLGDFSVQEYFRDARLAASRVAI